jgi:2-(1,2-epoxy-1,2-dihydrophenyl)acetyl-CoA isomerase
LALRGEQVVTDMSSDSIRLGVADGVGTLTLDRPGFLNALDADMGHGLAGAVEALVEDPAVACLVVRGAGDHFMAGGDVKHFHGLLELEPGARREAVGEMIVAVHQAIRCIQSSPKPVLASVRGACAGFGVSLMAACDLALAADDAVFSLAYVRIGTSPDGGSTWFLPRAVGAKRAMELALLGDRFTAVEAHGYGLVNRVVPVVDLEAETARLAGRLAQGPAETLARTKRLVAGSLEASLEAQLTAEQACFLAAVDGPEFEEGVRAFVEKRPARFRP